uniref:Protein FMP32 n=1 Tax=Rhizophora mucronata TaxID=61149 RepID=A0A2P2KUJ1_RHIMU
MNFPVKLVREVGSFCVLISQFITYTTSFKIQIQTLSSSDLVNFIPVSEG